MNAGWKFSLVALAIAASACSQSSAPPEAGTLPPANGTGSTAGGGTPCTPLETREANASKQTPTFAGQTRACGEATNVAFDVTVVARGLDHPWAVEPLPDGRFLVTERPGRLRVIAANGALGAPVAGLPAVETGGQGGLLDVALSPTFATDRTIFWSYSEPRDGGNATSVARGVLAADGSSVSSVRVIFRALPAHDNGFHFGSRLAFGPDGMLYVTLGDRAALRELVQKLDNHMGKLVRIAPDGSVPQDNPFVGQAGARPEIWAIGFRNVQSSAFDAEGRFWTIEHGTRGGDELNLVEKGKNYGWPIVTFGEEYSGGAIDDAVTTRAGFVDPVYYWDPVIAPSGAQFYSGSAFPAWRGSLFIGALKEQRLVRLSIRGNRVTGEEHLLVDRRERIRDVRQGVDGALYVVTDESDGELWRIAPR